MRVNGDSFGWILSGSGKFVVLQVGKNSPLGRMGDLLLSENDLTPL